MAAEIRYTEIGKDFLLSFLCSRDLNKITNVHAYSFITMAEIMAGIFFKHKETFFAELFAFGSDRIFLPWHLRRWGGAFRQRHNMLLSQSIYCDILGH